MEPCFQTMNVFFTLIFVIEKKNTFASEGDYNQKQK